MIDPSHPSYDIVRRVAAKDQRYAKLLEATDDQSPLPTANPTPLPCIHLGSPVRGEAAPDTARDYRACDHPDKPLGAVVCSCRGCGPKCSGYSV